MTTPPPIKAGPDFRKRALERAAEYVRGAGLTVLDRDWHHDEGTLDLVALEKGVLVACVLMTGRGSRELSRARKRRTRLLAVRWLAAHGRHCEQVRVDVIGYLRQGTGGHTIEHVRGVA